MTWTPDPATASVFTTLVINSIIGAVFLICFELFRNKNIDIYAPRLRKLKQSGVTRPHGAIFSWFKQISEVNDSDLLHLCGVDGYVFLHYLRMFAKIGGVCCLFLVILLPTYYTAVGTKGVVGIGLFSMANVSAGGDRLWACLIFTYIFTFVFLYFMYHEYEHFATIRKQFFKEGDPTIPPQRNYSVLVENIPLEYRSTKSLRAFFDKAFPGEVVYCNIAVYLAPLDQVVIERNTAVAKLESTIAVYEANPEKVRPMLKLKKGKVAICGGDESVDAINYYSHEVDVLNAKVATLQAVAIQAEHGKFIAPRTGSDHQESGHSALSLRMGLLDNSHVSNSPIADETRSRRAESAEQAAGNKAMSSSNIDNTTTPRNEAAAQSTADRKVSKSAARKEAKQEALLRATMTGFVTFKSRRAQVVACQVPILSEQYPRVSVVAAPAPADIIWDNIGTSVEYTSTASFHTSVVYYVGLAMWAVIMAFIAAVSNLSTLSSFLPFLKSLDTVTYSLLQGLLPVVILVVFLALLPMIMAYVARNIEKRKTESGVQLEVFKWFFMYQLANVYLILLAGSIFDSLESAIDDPASIITLIGAALPLVSTFFINFILTSLLVGVPGVMFRLVPLLIYKLYRVVFKESAMTRRAYVEGPLADCTMDYGTTLPGFLYIMCLTLLYWVIAPILLIVSTIFFATSYIAWKYQYIYVIERKHESGGLFFYGLYHNSMMGLLFGNVTMIGFMGIKEGAAQTPLLLPLLLIVLYAWRHTEHQFKSLSLNIPYTAAVDSDISRAESASAQHSLLQERGDDVTSFTPQGAGESKREQEQQDLDSDSSDIVSTFTEDFNKQPNLTNKDKAYPYPYRVNNTPLFSPSGELSEVYHEDVPSEVDVAAEASKYVDNTAMTIIGAKDNDAIAQGADNV